MKSQTRPSISDELAIPKPAPGENVYPIYSQGAICGYIYSGGNQKTHKIFLNGDNQSSSAEQTLTKKKTNDLKEKSCVAKTSKKTATKVKPKQSVKPIPQKQKAVSPTKKISLLPNKSGTEPKALIKTPSIKVNIPCSPAKQPKGDIVDLGKKTSPDNNTSLPVCEVPSKLVISPVKNNIQQLGNPTNVGNQLGNPTNVGNYVTKQNSNLQPSVITTASSTTNLSNNITVPSQVTSSAKDTVILPSPLVTNPNPQVILAPSNPALQSTKWLTTPVQPAWPNTVTYFIMPTGTVNQSPVYLTNSGNTLSTIFPTVTNMPLTTATPTSTVSTVNSSAVKLSTPAMMGSNTTMPITVMNPQVPNNSNQFLTNLPLKAIVPKSTFVQLPFQPSSSSPSSLLNKKIDVLNQNQPTAPQFKTLKILKQVPHLENGNGASETQSSVNGPSGVNNITNEQTSKLPVGNSHLASKDQNSFVLIDGKQNKDSASLPRDTKSSSSSNNEADGSAAEPSTKTVQEKTIGRELSTKSNQLNKSEASRDEDNPKETANESCLENNQFIIVPMKKPRGRPKKTLIAPKYEKRKEIPILPATGNNESGLSVNSQSFNLLPSGNYVISFMKEVNDGSLSKNQSEEELANLSQYESNKGNNGNGTETLLDKSSEEKEIYDFSNEDDIVMKTEPLDEFSDLSQKEIENRSDNPSSSTSTFTADVHNKEKKNSEEEKELVISSCFSFGINTKSSLLSASDTKRSSSSSNKADVTVAESTKTVDTELSTKSNQSNNSKVFSDEDIPKEIRKEYSLENGQFILVPVKKPTGQIQNVLVIPKYKKHKEIPILPAMVNNTKIEHSNKSQSFNLLPSGKFVIPTLKKANNGILSKNQLIVSNVSREKENNSNRTETIMDKSSLCEEKEMNDLSNEDDIVMKTEPLDEFSGLSQKEIENWSDNRPSSASTFTADIQDKLPCKKEKRSENELTSFQEEEEEEKELVISSCFSLSSPIESQKKNFPFSTVNSNFDNLFFLPSKTDSNVEGEKSTNPSEEIKLKNCSVLLEPLVLTSDSHVLSSSSSSLPSSSEEENGVKNANSSCNSSLNEDELNVKTLDSSASVSTKGTKRLFEDPAKSGSDQKCLKKLKETHDNVDQTENADISNEVEIQKTTTKSKSESVSKNSLLIQDFINNTLKKSHKSSSALPSNDDAPIVDLTEDEETDSFIEGCIAFHQHQLYLLQLQMDQHKKALEKLKKAQNYLNVKE